MEIHQICIRHNIEYFLTDELALLAHRKIDIANSSIDSGKILMTANNFKKFIKCCENNILNNRAVEWMGNSENFPGIFARYIDTSTTYYTHERLICEKHLGMYITIEILRPGSRFDIYYQVYEKTYENITKGHNVTGKKLEPLLRYIYLKTVKRKDKGGAAKDLSRILLRTYGRGPHCRKYWIKDSNGTIKYYSAELFSKHELCKLEDMELCISSKNILLLQETYGKWRYETYKIKVAGNSMDLFCDPEISYKELNLYEHADIIKNIMNKEAAMRGKIRSYRKEKDKILDRIFKIYYKFYFSIELADNIEELEYLYEKNEFEKLDSILQTYINVMDKYGKIYISDRVTSLVEKMYGADVMQLFKDINSEDEEGIHIYNYKGEYIKTLGGHDYE